MKKKTKPNGMIESKVEEVFQKEEYKKRWKVREKIENDL